MQANTPSKYRHTHASQLKLFELPKTYQCGHKAATNLAKILLNTINTDALWAWARSAELAGQLKSNAEDLENKIPTQFMELSTMEVPTWWTIVKLGVTSIHFLLNVVSLCLFFVCEGEGHQGKVLCGRGHPSNVLEGFERHERCTASAHRRAHQGDQVASSDADHEEQDEVSVGTLAGFRMATHGLLACNPCLGCAGALFGVAGAGEGMGCARVVRVVV